MKKREYLFSLIVLVFVCSCGKEQITARYFPRVPEDALTKAVFHDETHAVTWENGDVLDLLIDIRPQVPEEDFCGVLSTKYNSIDIFPVKMVFNNGAWTTLRQINGAWTEVDCIVVSAPSTKYEVSLMNTYDNKNLVGDESPERIRVSLHWTIPFIQGDQILDILIPYEDYKWSN